jgi:hypothetical protein
LTDETDKAVVLDVIELTDQAAEYDQTEEMPEIGLLGQPAEAAMPPSRELLK